jgi:hypothetical protein
MTTAMTSRLHAALIWGGEPIADVVLDRPGPITIGPVAGATFTVPDLGLPEVFPIVRPGETGYIVQLGQAMGGTMSLGGVRTEVGALVADREFAAAAIRPGDWGVVDLDGGGLQLFFQVAPAPERIAAKRSWDLETVMPAVAFSVLLHLFLLIASYRVGSTQTPFVFPQRSLAIQYIATRLPPPPQVVPVFAPPQPNEEEEEHGEASPQRDVEKRPDPRKGAEDAGDRNSGGPDDRNTELESDPEPGVGLVDKTNRELLHRLRRSNADIDKFLKRKKPLRVGQRPGGTDDELPGSRHGDGKDGAVFTPHQGDGDGDGDGKCKKGDKDCAKDGSGPRVPDKRTTDLPGEIEIARPDDITVDDDDIDRGAIAKAIESRKGLFKTCFQKSMWQGGGDGELVVRFVLAPGGQVTSAKVERSSIADATLKACVQRNIMSITKFPKSRDGAIVRYPFMFHGGGE